MTKKSPEIGPGRLGPIAAAFLIACLPVVPLRAQDANAGSPGLPKERTAFTLSLTGTLASWGLMLASWAPPAGDAPSEISSAIVAASVIGVMIGPSFGYFYGGCWGRGLLMTGLRVGVSALALAYALENDEKDNTALAVLMAGTLVGSAIFECATVKSAVRKHNAARLAKRGPKLDVSPFPARKGAGLNVRLSF